MASENRVVARYAQALWKFKQDASGEIVEELNTLLVELGKQPALWSLLNDPTHSAEDRVKALEQHFPHLSADSRSTLHLILNKGRVILLPEIVDGLHHRLLMSRNTVEVMATTAVELDQEQEARLIQGLERRLQKKVVLRSSLDPHLLGGLVLTTEDWSLDLSLQGQLQRVHEHLAK